MSMIVAALGRILIAVLFIVSGLQKVADPAGAAAMLESARLPGQWAQGIGVFELVAGVMLAIGVLARFVAFLLFGFVALTTFFFHHAFTDPLQFSIALKNLAIMGGLLMVFAYGQMRWSYDHWRSRDKIRKAELKAARAEGKAEGLASAPPRTAVVRED